MKAIPALLLLGAAVLAIYLGITGHYKGAWKAFKNG